MNIRKIGTASNTNNRHRRQRGFTAVELMTAIAVITVVASVVIPTVMTQYEKAR